MYWSLWRFPYEENELRFSSGGTNVKRSKVKECPQCGEKELGIGKHTGYGVMYPKNKVSIGSEIEYMICTGCGFIIEGYVKKPEKFKETLY